MPLPALKDTSAWRILLEAQKWAGFSDHELCDRFVEAGDNARRILKLAASCSIQLDIAECQLAMTTNIQEALYSEIVSRMKAIVRRSFADIGFIEEMAQTLMLLLMERNERTSISLRGAFPGANGSFVDTVKKRTIDTLRKETARQRREPSLDAYSPPLVVAADQQEKMVDLDQLRAYITNPMALAVFDKTRAGLQQCQIANELGITDRTVRRHLARALDTIREKHEAEDN